MGEHKSTIWENTKVQFGRTQKVQYGRTPTVQFGRNTVLLYIQLLLKSKSEKQVNFGNVTLTVPD